MRILYGVVGEGTNSSMAVSRLPSGYLNYHNAGKVQASSEPQDMRLQRMLGHLPALVHPHPRSVLVVGCGAVVALTYVFTVHDALTEGVPLAWPTLRIVPFLATLVAVVPSGSGHPSSRP